MSQHQPDGGTSDARLVRGRSTRQRIVAAARKQFAERGYEATSIGAVLVAAGVAKGALYHHFPSKTALFDAVLDQVVAEIAAAAAAASRAAATPLERLRAGCFTWLDLAVDPGLQRIALIDAPSVVGWTRWRELDEEHVLRGLRIGIERMASGDDAIAKAQVGLLAHMVLAAVNEAALMIAGADDHDAALAEGKQAVDVLLTRLAGAS